MDRAVALGFGQGLLQRLHLLAGLQRQFLCLLLGLFGRLQLQALFGQLGPVVQRGGQPGDTTAARRGGDRVNRADESDSVDMEGLPGRRQGCALARID